MRTKITLKAGAAALFAMAATAASAQTTYVRPAYQFPVAPPASGPASIQLADTPFFVLPYLGAAFGHDDNLFLSHTNEKGSSLYVVSPGVKVDARDANKVFQLGYQGQIGRYTSSSDDNYVDHTARAQFDMALDAHNFVKIGYDYIRSHDPRGSTDRPIAGSPDKYRQSDPYVTYALGAPGAQGRVELYYSDPYRRYLNNRQFTTANDREMQDYGGAFYWRVMPRTYVMVEARGTNIRYDVAGSPLSADERRYYGGVSWEATAATTGTIKVGQLRRDFRNEDQPTFSGASWEGLISWAPRSYSKFDFYTARQTNESTGLGRFILSSLGGVTWTHSWSSYVSTAVDARYQKDDYQGFDRNDRSVVLGVKAAYRFRRWLTLGAEYAHSNRDSNLDIFDYDKNIYLLTLTASM
jgi:hypothetical protein